MMKRTHWFTLALLIGGLTFGATSAFAQYCGDAACDPGEFPYTCPEDCPLGGCGDGVCDISGGEDADSCGADCGPCNCWPGDDGSPAGTNCSSGPGVVPDDSFGIPAVCDQDGSCTMDCVDNTLAFFNSCVPYQCTGSMASSSIMCPNADTGLVASAPWSLAGNGPAVCAAKCESYCPDGRYAIAGVTCFPNTCTAGIANTRTCPGDTSGIPGHGTEPFKLVGDLVADCDGAATRAAKCEQYCDGANGWQVDGTGLACESITGFTCGGAIAAGSTRCTPMPPPAAKNWTLLGNGAGVCTGTPECERYCAPGTRLSGGICVSNVCTGQPLSAFAWPCPGDETNPGNPNPHADNSSAMVAGLGACTARSCEYYCVGGQEICGVDCVPVGTCFSCTGATAANSTLCAGDSSGLSADTPKTTVAACTAGTKCEYTCNAGYVDGGANVCNAQTFNCTGSTAANSTLCAGDDSGLSADTPKTTVGSCTAGTKCEYTCNAGYVDGGANVCNAQTFNCTGSTAANSTLCAGDDSGLSADTPKTTVGSCTAGTKCEYTCNAGYVDGGANVCNAQTFNCTGSTAANSTLCAGDDSGLSADTPRTTVGSCTAGTKCEYTCNTGYVDGGANVCNAQTFNCTGSTAANSTLCAGDDSGLSADTPRTTVGSCTAGTKCEYTCNTGYRDGGANTCTLNVCTGTPAANSTVCSGDTTNIPGSSDVARTTVDTCTAGTKCEYTCNAGYVDGGANVCDLEIFTCIGSTAANSTLCTGDSAGLSADTPKTTVGSCTAGTKCEYTCNTGYRDGGANTCTLNVCTGTPAANSTVCSGDTTNIPGSSDVARTTVAACTAGTKCEYTCNTGYRDGGANTCTLNVCTGTPAANSTVCSGDTTNIPGSSDVARTTVAACTAGTKCEYTCNTGYRDGGANTCTLNVCTGSAASNATLCSGDSSGLSADTPRTTVAACTAGTKCEYTCNAGYVDGGANVCNAIAPCTWSSCIWYLRAGPTPVQGVANSEYCPVGKVMTAWSWEDSDNDVNDFNRDEQQLRCCTLACPGGTLTSHSNFTGAINTPSCPGTNCIIKHCPAGEIMTGFGQTGASGQGRLQLDEFLARCAVMTNTTLYDSRWATSSGASVGGFGDPGKQCNTTGEVVIAWGATDPSGNSLGDMTSSETRVHCSKIMPTANAGTWSQICGPSGAGVCATAAPPCSGTPSGVCDKAVPECDITSAYASSRYSCS